MASGRGGWRWLGLLVGLALFVWVLRESDLRGVWKLLVDFRWRFGMVLLFYVVIFGLDTLGWKFALRPQMQSRIPWARLFRARLAGEAVNYVTPTAWIGGEPVKAWILSRRYGVPMQDGMASVVIAKTTFTLSMMFFIVLGLIVTAVTQPASPALMRWVWVILPVLTVLIGLFVLVQFLQPFRRGLEMLSQLLPWFRKVEAKMQEWDHSIVSFYRQAPASVFWSLGFHFLGWLAGAVEVYLILHFLHLPVSWATAFSLEALWVLLRSGAFLIPASIGASEGFLLLICSGLGVSSVTGLALGLIRRAREVAWMSLGLLEFSRGA